MKAKLFTMLLFISFSTLFSQTMDELKVSTEKMYKASYEIDLNTVMDLTYPKVFEIVDRETLLSAMEGVFKNEVLEISFTKATVPFSYSEIKTIDGKKFNIIRYQNNMKMKLMQDVGEAGVEAMKEGLNSSGKFKTITYDAKSNSFIIESNAILIGVADESTKNKWTFLNYDDDTLFTMVFDESYKAKLGL